MHKMNRNQRNHAKDTHRLEYLVVTSHDAFVDLTVIPKHGEITREVQQVPIH
jgi:hypothetical protein